MVSYITYRFHLHIGLSRKEEKEHDIAVWAYLRKPKNKLLRWISDLPSQRSSVEIRWARTKCSTKLTKSKEGMVGPEVEVALKWT